MDTLETEMELQFKHTILLISPLPPPFGGICAWTQTVCEKGLPEPFDFELINTSIGDNRVLFEPTRATVKEIVRNILIVLKFLKKLLFSSSAIIHLNSSLSPTGIVRDWFLCRLSCFFHKRILVEYHGNVPDFPLGGWWGLRRRLLHDLIRSATQNIVINQSSYRMLKELIPPAKIDICPNFIEIKSTSQPQQNRDRNRSKVEILYVGSVSEPKGISTLISIAENCPEMEFILIGKPTKLISSIKNRLDNSVNIHLLGERTNEEVRERMLRSDIYFFPSRSEGFPVSVLEAMASSLPVVASSVGAIPEMIEDSVGGFLHSPNDIPGFVLSLTRLAQNPNLRRNMGKENFKKAITHYEYSVVISQICSIYQKMLKL